MQQTMSLGIQNLSELMIKRDIIGESKGALNRDLLKKQLDEIDQELREVEELLKD